MSLRADTTSLIPGRLCASLYPGFGVRGADVPTTGDHGGSIGANDIDSGDDDKEFIFEILTKPSGGEITFAEDGSFDAVGFPDGIHVGTYRLKVGGVVIKKADDSDPTYELRIGEAVGEKLLILDVNGSIAYKAPGGGDRRLYITADGRILAKSTNDGDRQLQLENGRVVASQT